jgi:integrase/recombinase XerD
MESSMQTEEARTRLRSDLEHYLSTLVQDKLYSPNTVAAYRNDLGQFLDRVVESGAAPEGEWRSLTPARLADYVQHMKDTKLRNAAGREKPIAMSTVARKIAALKSFFRYLVEHQRIEVDPTQGLDAPKVEKRPPRTLSSEEVAHLLAAPGSSNQPKVLRDRALLELLYATGMRVSELVSLNLDDVNLVTHDVRVRNDRGDKERIIPVHDRAIEALQAYLARGRPSLLKNLTDQPALFLNHRGQKLTRQGMWLIIKEYAERAGIPYEVTPHTLRHSFASHMLAGHKASLGEVQHFLGHANVSTTQIYSQIAADQKPDSAEEVTDSTRLP